MREAIQASGNNADEMGHNGTDNVRGSPSDDSDRSSIVFCKNGDNGIFIMGWRR